MVQGAGRTGPQASYPNGYMTALGEVIAWCESEAKKLDTGKPKPQ